MEDTRAVNNSGYNNDEEVIDLHVLFADVKRGMAKFWWLLIIFVCFMVATVVLFKRARYVPTYESKASFTVSTENLFDTDLGSGFTYDRYTAKQMAATFPYIMESELLTDLVKHDLGVESINGTISATCIENSNLITLSVTSTVPEDAKKILDSAIRNYPTVSQYVMGNIRINMIEVGNLPDKPNNAINYRKLIILSAFVGIVLWFVLLFVYAYFRRTVRSEEEVKEKLDLTCLGSLPLVRFKKRNKETEKKISINSSKCPQAFKESVRKISLRVIKELSAEDEKVLTVTAASEGEGSNVVAENIALAISETNKKVLFIKTAPSSKGYMPLRKLLEGKANFSDCVETPKNSKLSVVIETRGIQELQTPKMLLTFSKFIDKMKEIYDYIVIAPGTGSNMSDVVTSVSVSDNVVLVVRQDTSTVKQINDFMDELREYDISVSGCVLNCVDDSSMGYGYSSYGYGGYSYSSYGRYGRYGRYGKYGYGRYGRYGKYGYGSSYGAYGAYGDAESQAAEE